MKPIQPTVTPVEIFDAKSAVREMQRKHAKGPVIGYHTQTAAALLVCLSKGGPRNRKSVCSNDPLWGFIYLEEPLREAKFVRNSAVESVEMVLGNGSKVALWDSLEELQGRVDTSSFKTTGSPAETLAELRNELDEDPGPPVPEFPPVPKRWKLELAYRFAGGFRIVCAVPPSYRQGRWNGVANKWEELGTIHRINLANLRKQTTQLGTLVNLGTITRQ